MSNEAISGGLRRGKRQGAGSVKQVLNSLAFLDKAGPNIPWEHLPRTAKTMEGLIHVLQCLDEFFRGRFVIFCFAWHRHFLISKVAPATTACRCRQHFFRIAQRRQVGNGTLSTSAAFIRVVSTGSAFPVE
jgi:hypothetical protein